MSAGQFVRSLYEATYQALIHPIRVQPETLLAEINSVLNAAPTGTATSPISACVSKGNNALGLGPRCVTLETPETGAPAGYQPGGIIKIPALNQSFWDEAVPGAPCTYLGVTFTVVSRQPESVR